MTRFETMSEEEARRILDHTRRAIAAQLQGGIHSDDPYIRGEARLMSLQAETHKQRLAAERRVRPVVTDEERQWLAAFRAAVAKGADVRAAGLEANRATGRVRVQRRGHFR